MGKSACLSHISVISPFRQDKSNFRRKACFAWLFSGLHVNNLGLEERENYPTFESPWTGKYFILICSFYIRHYYSNTTTSWLRRSLKRVPRSDLDYLIQRAFLPIDINNDIIYLFRMYLEYLSRLK